jgi:hypothetical protein
MVHDLTAHLAAEEAMIFSVLDVAGSPEAIEEVLRGAG